MSLSVTSNCKRVARKRISWCKRLGRVSWGKWLARPGHRDPRHPYSSHSRTTVPLLSPPGTCSIQINTITNTTGLEKKHPVTLTAFYLDRNSKVSPVALFQFTLIFRCNEKIYHFLSCHNWSLLKGLLQYSKHIPRRSNDFFNDELELDNRNTIFFFIPIINNSKSP